MLIRIKAFGLNRSEMFTRQGHSPTVKFPRILGIEAAGVIEEAPGNEEKFKEGDVVATAMGGMGREFDGGYAEYTVVPASQVQVVKSADKISWEMLGALPEMMQTTWGALFKALRLQKNDRLLIRGGTTSVGLAAAAIAKSQGAFVAATTRKPEREQLLRANGAEQVFVDNGSVADQIEQTEGFNKVLEMVGVTTLRDSLQCVEEGGTVCMVGSVSGKWAFDDEFSPMVSIPTAVSLTAYHSSAKALIETPLDEIVTQLGTERIKALIGKVFVGLDKVNEAHRCMDEDRAGGKIVILIDDESTSKPWRTGGRSLADNIYSDQSAPHIY